MASVSWDGKNSKCHKPAEAKVMLKHFDPRAESRAEIREIKDRSGEICHIRTENSKYNIDLHVTEGGKVMAEIMSDIPAGGSVFSSYDVTIPKHKEELKRLDALPKQNLRKNRVINQMVEFPAGDWLTFDPDGTEETKRTEGGKPTIAQSLCAYFCNPSALLATCGFVAIVFANNAYLSWAPKFMARRFDLTVGSAGNGTMLYHHIAAFASIMFGAFLTDAFVKSRPRFRLGLQMCALILGAPMLVLIGFSPSVTFAWIAVAAYGVFRGLFEVNSHASLFDVVPPQHRSTAEGMMTMIAFFIGSLSPLMIGALSDRYGIRGFEIGFSVLGAGYVLGAVAIAISFFRTFRRDAVRE